MIDVPEGFSHLIYAVSYAYLLVIICIPVGAVDEDVPGHLPF